MSNFRRRLMMSIETKTAAKKVYENPIEYYGKRITNYSANGVSDWKIFHSDGKNVYIIASDYVPVDKLPETEAGHKPVNTNSSYPKAASFSNVINDYAGSENITDEKIKALNNDYFTKEYTSTNNNMKKVAYMLDTSIWSSFKTEKSEYAVGGPTIEMLIASYNKTHDVDYRAKASSSIGYEISQDGGVSWKIWCNGMLSTSDSLYVINSQTNAQSMWLASPSVASPNPTMLVRCYGDVGYDAYNYASVGFRPIICLKSNISLKEVEGGYEIL